MAKQKKVWGLFFLLFIFGVSWVYSQTEPPPAKEPPLISLVGRLALEKHGSEEWLVLHGKTADTYILIEGELCEQLKNSLLKFGQNNLVSVTAREDGRSATVCEQDRHYEYNKEGRKELKVQAKCIRYKYLVVTQILSAEKSDQEIPPPKRDLEEERRMLSRKVIDQNSIPLVTGEIYGRVSAVNLKSPLKTVEITNRNKNDPLKKITLMISTNTRIVKKIGEQEPMALSEKALKRGQEVTAMYFRDEFKAEALFITITQE